MLLRIRSACSRPISIHRTFLTEDGEKAPVPNVKKLMTGTRLLDGAAIRVFESDSRTLGICEGFETGLAIARARKYRICVWSLINAGNLVKAAIPKDRFDSVIIFADHDALDPKKGYRPGEHAARELKERLLAEGFEVEIKIPTHQGQDFADVWLEWYKLPGSRPLSEVAISVLPQVSQSISKSENLG
jgi:putative DNA primase/helicase